MGTKMINTYILHKFKDKHKINDTKHKVQNSASAKR